MGSVFRYIHDDALFPCGGDECHHCESKAEPVFDYFGYIVNPALAATPTQAAEFPDVDELCASCILGANVRKHIVDNRVQATINRFARDKDAALEEFHRTPNIPLFLQHVDRPSTP